MFNYEGGQFTQCNDFHGSLDGRVGGNGMMGSKECNPANKHELWNGYGLGQRICVEQVDPNRTQIGSTFWAFVGSPLSRAKKVNFLNVLHKEF